MISYSKKNLCNRIIAGLLSFVMMLSIVVNVTPSAAASGDVQNDAGVTILVTDDNNQPLKGAVVTYSIIVDDVEVISDVETSPTGDDGVVSVITAEELLTTYAGKTVKISATATCEDYKIKTAADGKEITVDDRQVTLVMEELPSIPVNKITALTGKYKVDVDALPADAFEVLFNEGEDKGQYKISYKRFINNAWEQDWTEGTGLKVEKAGIDYKFKVQITRDGYKTYEETLTARVEKADIPDSDINFQACENRPYDGSETTAVTTDADLEKYKIEYTYDGKTISESPVVQNIGTYKIVATATIKDENEKDNYNEYSRSFDIVISKNDGSPILEIIPNENIQPYNGKEQVLASLKGDYFGTLKYRIKYTDISGNTTDDTELREYTKDTVFSGKDAGSYEIILKPDENYYNQADEITKEIVIKKEQTIEYVQKEPMKSSVEVQCSDKDSNDKEKFEIEDSFAIEGADTTAEKYSYKIVYSGSGEDVDKNIAEIDENGNLYVYKGGYVIDVISTAEGDNNYAKTEKKHRLELKCIDDNLSFKDNGDTEKENTVQYTVQDNNLISNRVAEKKHSDDNGEVKYAIKLELKGEEINYDDYGIKINNGQDDEKKGEVTYTELKKLDEKLSESKGGALTFYVVATKKAGTMKVKDDPKVYEVYKGISDDSVYYKLTIKYAALPSDAYSLKDSEGVVLENSDYYGTKIIDGKEQKWYRTAVNVVANGECLVSTEVNGTYTSEITFNNQGKADRKVYVKYGDKFCGSTIIPVKYIDTEDPHDIKIIYPEKDKNGNYVKKQGVNYYGTNQKLMITLTGDDTSSTGDVAFSGIKNFYYAYVADGQNCPEDTKKYTKVDFKEGKASIELPVEDGAQLKGVVAVYAEDYAGNISAIFPDNGNPFVVDTISPTVNASYKYAGNKGTASYKNKIYYAPGNVEFKFEFTEDNFFPDDAEIYVYKDGKKLGKDKVNQVWNNNTAIIKLTEQGEYKVEMSYTDRSGNTMDCEDEHKKKHVVEYESELIVIDTKAPVVEFSYDKDTQTATVKVTEKYFDKNSIEVVTNAKYINGDKAGVNDIQTYLRGTNKNSNAVWDEKEGNVHVATISNYFNDAIYKLTFDYADYAGNKAETVTADTFKVDRAAPKALSISYSQPIKEQILANVTFGYYNPKVKVTFTAYDKVTGVDHFTWSYKKQSGASEENVDKYDERSVKAVQDNSDKTKFTATVELPLTEVKQIRGNITYQATDKYANKSNKVTDLGHVIVVDTIAPTMTVEYSEADNKAGAKYYYNNSAKVTFNVIESNFDKNDIKVKVTKNGNPISRKLVWKDADVDNHIGILKIPAKDNHRDDGEYVITVEYTDKSNNIARKYKSKTIVIDTKKPVIDVTYANHNVVYNAVDSDGNNRHYFDADQTATVKITETNFNSKNVVLDIVAKDVAGNEYNIDDYITKSSWNSSGNVHTMTIKYPEDANYSFDIGYSDEATNKAAKYTTDYFTVDKTAPTNLNIEYSDSVIDTVLENLTLGFYNSKTTVTLTAEDATARVHEFEYSYRNAADVSGVNAELINQALSEADITYSNGGRTATAKFEIPREALGAQNQFNGNVDFIATDRADNKSKSYKDQKRIVVDNIKPVADVQFNEPVNSVDGVEYYAGDINGTITINEANFYSDKVIVAVTKDGADYPVDVNWTNNDVDTHVGKFTLTEDGNYIVTVDYQDYSDNAMTQYKSSQMTIDTEIVKPSITVQGTGEDVDKKAFNNEVGIEVSYEDVNFDKCEVVLERVVYNKATNSMDKEDKTADFVTPKIETTDNGISVVIDGMTSERENDGIYTLTVKGYDKAKNVGGENVATFSLNRFGSTYDLGNQIKEIVGKVNKQIDSDIVITEINANNLHDMEIVITKDGKPLENSDIVAKLEDRGRTDWYKYTYTINRELFSESGLYKVSLYSQDEAGNKPVNVAEGDTIEFYVDKTCPEFTGISGLEKDVVNANELTVKYSVYDGIGLKQIIVTVDGSSEVIEVTGDETKNYSGQFILKESSKPHEIVILAEDLAGNKFSTSNAENKKNGIDETFAPSFSFNDEVTVSTNFFVRWYANKVAFWGGIIGIIALISGAVLVVISIKKKMK